MLYKQLRQGTRRFKVSEDGTQTHEDLPPTRRELQASNMLEQLANSLEAMHRSYQTCQREFVNLTEQIDLHTKAYVKLEQELLNQTQEVINDQAI